MNNFSKFHYLRSLLLSALFFCFYGCGGGKKGGGAETGGGGEAKEGPAARAAGIPIPTEGAEITGTVKFEGKVPKLREIDMSDEPVCSARWKEKGETPVSEALVLGADNALANVFVSIKSGLGGETYAPPAAPVVVEQLGCRYVPHVFALMKGQGIEFKNLDGVLHNVHALPSKNREFNLAMPGSMKTSTPRVFKKTEPMFRIKCDKHPWMNSYAAVVDNPFFAVTGKDGRFAIKGLPPGTYEVEAWHEKMGTRTATLTVAKDETQSVDFSFSR